MMRLSKLDCNEYSATNDIDGFLQNVCNDLLLCLTSRRCVRCAGV